MQPQGKRRKIGVEALRAGGLRVSASAAARIVSQLAGAEEYSEGGRPQTTIGCDALAYARSRTHTHTHTRTQEQDLNVFVVPLDLRSCVRVCVCACICSRVCGCVRSLLRERPRPSVAGGRPQGHVQSDHCAVELGVGGRLSLRRSGRSFRKLICRWLKEVRSSGLCAALSL